MYVHSLCMHLVSAMAAICSVCALFVVCRCANGLGVLQEVQERGVTSSKNVEPLIKRVQKTRSGSVRGTKPPSQCCVYTACRIVIFSGHQCPNMLMLRAMCEACNV